MKRILLLFGVVLAALQMTAADVSTAQAQAAANAFLNKQVATGRLKASAASNLQLVKAEKSVFKPSAVDYYIFNSAKSYVVVSGDDLAPQILMYGEEGSLDLNNIPPGMQWLLNKYKYQIDGLKAGTMEPVKAPKFATVAVAPLVTANWDQSSPYNNQCPTSGGWHAVTGCPATSLAMCYYKWKWPYTYPAVAAISSYNGIAAPALGEREADWANIIDEYTGPTNYSSTNEQKDAVAWLMRYAGQSIPDYSYGTSASGANDPEIFQGCKNMGYTDAQYLLLTELVGSGWSGYSNGPQQYTDAEWNEYMMNELLNGRPIEYLAYDYSGYSLSGHAFNVFGCNTSGQYYVNWGWSGDSNGYCTLHNFTTATGATGQAGSYVFNYGEAMIIGIEPPAGALTDPRIKANPSTLTMNTTVGTPITETFTVTGYNLTDDVNLALAGDDAFSMNTTNIAVAQVENGVTVTVTYDPASVGRHEANITLTSTDAENVTVKLNGHADPTPLETYPPVMLEATNVASTSFTAVWSDETPAENVESYTLYVSDQPFKPAIALLDSIDWTHSANLPEGWSANGLSYYSTNSAAYLNSSGYVRSRTYDLTDYDKVTVMIYSEPYNTSNTLKVATSIDSKNINLPSGSSFTWYTYVLNCASSDYINITSQGMPDMRYVKVYAGDLSEAMQLKASETGDASSRVITGITGKSYTVTGLNEAGTYYYYVVANYTNTTVANSSIEQVTLLENTDPTIFVNPASLDMAAVIGETATATFNVFGANLTDDVTLALNDENGVYSIEPATISPADALNGVDVTVTYAPAAMGTDNATIVLTSAGAEDVTVTLNGTGNIEKYPPVMQPAQEENINLTKFRADWTDATPDANVESYTLEVNTKPEVLPYVELESADFSGLTAQVNSSNQYTNQVNNASNYLPAGWSASTALFIKDGAIVSGQLTQNSQSYACKVRTSTYDLTGSDKISVVFKAGTYSSSSNASVTLNVSTSAGSQDVTVNGYNYNTYSVVLDCAESDRVTFTGVSGLYCMSSVTIYAGDINATNTMLMAQETGDESYRLITDITDKFYTVENLTAEGTFLYRVKALYIDGTESDWSNVEEVTLFANQHPYQTGDVNHDGGIDVADVSLMIAAALGQDVTCCDTCGDITGDGVIDIADVSRLIRILLGNDGGNIDSKRSVTMDPQ